MTRKMDIAIEAIGARPGDHVLEVGGGWGAFVEHAGRRGIQVDAHAGRGVERYLSNFIAANDLPAQVVRRHVLEYSSPRRYDAIVNMGVTEHLPDYRAALRKYAELVKPGGQVYLNALAMRTKHNVSTFMSRYIYPGKSSPLLLHSYLRQVARSPFELVSIDDDRHNYYLTCREWARRLDAAHDEVVRRWGDPLYRPVPHLPVGLGRRFRHRPGAGLPLGAQDAADRDILSPPLNPATQRFQNAFRSGSAPRAAGQVVEHGQRALPQRRELLRRQPERRSSARCSGGSRTAGSRPAAVPPSIAASRVRVREQLPPLVLRCPGGRPQRPRLVGRLPRQVAGGRRGPGLLGLHRDAEIGRRGCSSARPRGR